MSRFALKSFRILTLAALLTVVAPVTFRAQEPAAPQQSAQPQQSASQEKSDDQENAFRLNGPIVKWTVRHTGLSAEFTARGFEILNFLILVFCVGVPLVRFMPKVFRHRSETVRSGLDEARKASAEAAARMSAIESKLSGLDAEIVVIRQQVEQESVRDEVRIKADIEAEKARIVADAEQEIASAAARARHDLQSYAVGLAFEQATGQVKLTEEDDKALINEFLNGVGGKN
jgi:F-type H+-transporting ATPase subunit b